MIHILTAELDPPEAQVLFAKGASIGFANRHAWTLSSSQMGRFLHILRGIAEQVLFGSFLAISVVVVGLTT
jgi:hypothetical protein